MTLNFLHHIKIAEPRNSGEMFAVRCESFWLSFGIVAPFLCELKNRCLLAAQYICYTLLTLLTYYMGTGQHANSYRPAGCTVYMLYLTYLLTYLLTIWEQANMPIATGLLAAQYICYTLLTYLLTYLLYGNRPTCQ